MPIDFKKQRAALADAIAARAEAARIVANNHAKLTQFEAAAEVAREAEAVARHKVETAASDRVQRLVDGLPSDADPSLRVDLDVAVENVEVTREAVRILRERLGPFDAQLARAEEAVKIAVNHLLGAMVPELLQEAENLRTSLESRRCVLSFLRDRLFDKEIWAQSAQLVAIDEYLGRSPFPLELGCDPLPCTHPAHQAWAIAATALEQDPNTALPA